ncbi:MAG: hypothetical protein OXC69_09985, partial [Candidatus Tectomicrobia bacterium]|nr:hypothetical protein [Candidatus Tectomicrobia bacterium]
SVFIRKVKTQDIGNAGFKPPETPICSNKSIRYEFTDRNLLSVVGVQLFCADALIAAANTQTTPGIAPMFSLLAVT